MASRNNYTITPSYGGNQRQTQPRITQSYAGTQPGAPRRPSAPASQKPSNDTFLLTMIFIVAPVCGLLGLPILAFRWMFIALSAFLIITIWITKRFIFQGRAFLSGVLVVAAVVSLISAVDSKASLQQSQYTPYSAGDPVLGSSLGASLQGGQGAVPTNPIDTTISNELNALLAQQQTDSPEGTLGGAVGAQATNAPERVLSDAEKALDNYLRMWQLEDFESMAQYTLPSWRNAQRVPPRQLSYQHKNYTLNSWEISGENQSSAIDSATFTVIVNVTKSNSTKATVYGKYSAILFNTQGTWYVDPNSMRSMITYEPPEQIADNTGASVIGVEQIDPDPTPEPVVSGKTKLYYNSDGGKFYHAEEQCSTIDPKFYSKIKSFTYADLGKSGYSKLKPCATCKAPK